ncbi:hypothetical protein ES708_05735 [subsurface metagenome]
MFVLNKRGDRRGGPGGLKPGVSLALKGRPNPIVSLALKGMKHPGVSLANRNRRGIPHVEEHKQKISESNAQAIIEGRHEPNSHYKHERITTLKGGTIWCRSSWEVEYARMLDADPEVIRFDYEKIKVPYVFEGIIHYTVVDFLVERFTGLSLVEVKPLNLILGGTKAKLEGVDCFARKLNIPFEVWDKSLGTRNWAELAKAEKAKVQ